MTSSFHRNASLGMLFQLPLRSFQDLFDRCRLPPIRDDLPPSPSPHICALCYDTRTERHLRVPCCGQLSGAVCLNEWFQKPSARGKCPFCRHILILEIPPTPIERLHTALSNLTNPGLAQRIHSVAKFQQWVLRRRYLGQDEVFNEKIEDGNLSDQQLMQLFWQDPEGSNMGYLEGQYAVFLAEKQREQRERETAARVAEPASAVVAARRNAFSGPSGGGSPGHDDGNGVR